MRFRYPSHKLPPVFLLADAFRHALAGASLPKCRDPLELESLLTCGLLSPKDCAFALRKYEPNIPRRGPEARVPFG
jgi:hypothetical protein